MEATLASTLTSPELFSLSMRLWRGFDRYTEHIGGGIDATAEELNCTALDAHNAWASL